MFSFKVIKSVPPATAQVNIMRQTMAQQVQPVLKQYVAQREQATSRFTHKPRYDSSISTRDVMVTVVIFLANANERVGNVTMATLLEWLYVTGTRAHTIIAKNARTLRFQGGSYTRKTEGGGGLSASGGAIYRRSVRHPGFAPSKQLDTIDKRFQPIIENTLVQAGQIGLQRAIRG